MSPCFCSDYRKTISHLTFEGEYAEQDGASDWPKREETRVLATAYDDTRKRCPRLSIKRKATAGHLMRSKTGGASIGDVLDFRDESRGQNLLIERSCRFDSLR